jgi:uncharacterized iron-regulated protein
MQNITIKNVPDYLVKIYGNEIDFSPNIFFDGNFDIDFRELDNSEITSEMLTSLEEAKNTPKHLLCNI